MILRYALAGAGRELLWIDTRRARYLLLQAAHPDWQDRAGLYASELDAALIERAESVATSIVASTVEPRGRHGPMVTASVGEDQVTTALVDPGAPVASLLSEAIDAVRPHPVSVVGLAAEMINDGDIRLVFTAVGVQPVDLQLRRESCRVSTLVDGGWQTVWSAGATDSARLTLVAAPVGFLDGVRSPAVLEPGVVARTMLPNALAGVADRSRVIVDIDATLAIPGTENWADDDAEPGLSMDVRDRWPIHLTAGVKPISTR